MDAYCKYLEAIMSDIERDTQFTETSAGWIVKKVRATDLGGDEYSLSARKSIQEAFRDALYSPNPLPDEMKRHLAFLFDLLCSGDQPEILIPLKRNGSPVNRKHEILRQSAIRYFRWVKEGKIIDNHPEITIAKAYGVCKETVKNWINSHNDNPADNFNSEWGADLIKKAMINSGKLHQILKPKSHNTITGK